MNLVLADTEEFRATKKSIAAAKKATSSASGAGASSSTESAPPIRETKRALGLVILRGETVISVSVEAPPPNTDPSARLGTSAAATAAAAGSTGKAGSARPINRSGAEGFGAPTQSAAATLSGPARTTAASFFGGNRPSGFGGAPPGFQPPPGFGGR